MIGFLVYETFDIIYHTCKFGVNVTSSLYNWYTSKPQDSETQVETTSTNADNDNDNDNDNNNEISNKEDVEKIKQLLENKINVLLERIEKLENEKIENEK
jgi:hypothetical protein